MENYLAALKKGRINPNFWCSDEYFKHANWVERQTDNTIFIFDSEGCIMLPPLKTHGSFAAPKGFDNTWSDLEGFPGYASSNKEFLDYEYLFKAKNFENMVGGKWSVFRKNCRKWPNRIDQKWEYKTIPEGFPEHRLEALLIVWLGGINPNEPVHDTDVLLQYIRKGLFRKGLFTEDGQLHALNIWDWNWKFINYRYCICNPEPFLSEFSRLLFYQDMYRIYGDVTVNDGGCLDRISLKEFKDHMNPYQIRKVYSWKSK